MLCKKSTFCTDTNLNKKVLELSQNECNNPGKKQDAFKIQKAKFLHE